MLVVNAQKIVCLNILILKANESLNLSPEASESSLPISATGMKHPSMDS